MKTTDKKEPGFGADIRGLLKNHHKKIYYICRLFADNYQEHRRLFVNILAAAFQNLQHPNREKERQVLFLRACINMAVLHSISKSLCPLQEKEKGKYKSPDYQKSMSHFREAIGGISDYEKIQLFLLAENVIPEEITASGVSTPGKNKTRGQKHNWHILPFIKKKLQWS